MVEQTQTEFFDPHFHMLSWGDELHAPAKAKAFSLPGTEFVVKNYEELVLGDGAEVKLVGGMFIEVGA
jgi:hypothetical protein